MGTMPRHQRIQSETGIYHIMMRGNEKKNLFLDDEDKQRFIETLFAKKNETGFFLYAYCLMDNHVHLLLKEDQENLAIIMKRINASYAYYFNQKNQRVGHLFQDRFKSEPIEDERYLLAVTRYIHNNPIKAGIIDKPEQYKWSSYNSYLTPYKPEATIIETEFILSIMANDPKIAITKFKAFSLEQDDTQYMDLEDGKIWTMEEGKSYLEDYLKIRWAGKSIAELIAGKDTRTDLIVELKSNTRLSIRDIASLLGVNRGIVQRTLIDR